MNDKKIKMVALDLDGTTLNEDKRISPRTVEDFRLAMEKGVHIVVSTGRTFQSLPEQLYFCDVGYGGPMPPGAIAVEEGAELKARGESYWMERADEIWWTVSRLTSAGLEEKVIQFYTVPQREVNFLPLSGYCAHSPDSVFTQKLFLNRRTEGGSVNILGDVFTRVEQGAETKSRIRGREELLHIIKTEFDIDLSGEEIPGI